jgi:hypothetical protein
MVAWPELAILRSSGPCGTRTHDPLRVMQVRYQLRQRPDGDDDTTATGVNSPCPLAWDPAADAPNPFSLP